MELKEEKKLIEKAKNDPEAFGEIFDLYYPKIFNYVLKRIGHVQEAQDITADSFYKAFHKFHHFHWREVSFGAWLYRIAGNEINNLSRRKSFLSLDILREELGFEVQSEENLVAEIESAEKDLDTEQDLSLLRQALAKLDQKYQETLALHYLSEKSILEICEITGKKEGTVKAQLSRGRDKLRELMQPLVLSRVIDTDL